MSIKASINVSNVSCKSCTLLWYVRKVKHLHEISVYFHNFFYQAYLIWGAQIRCAHNQYTAVQTDKKLSPVWSPSKAMPDMGKKSGRPKYKDLNISRTKRAF